MIKKNSQNDLADKCRFSCRQQHITSKKINDANWYLKKKYRDSKKMIYVQTIT